MDKVGIFFEKFMQPFNQSLMPRPDVPIRESDEDRFMDQVADQNWDEMEELAVRICSEMHKDKAEELNVVLPLSPAPPLPPPPVENTPAFVKVASIIKKKRTATSAHQLSILTAAFKLNRYPNQFARGTLANTCGMSKDRVRIWFQNMRRKIKASEMSPEPSDSMEDSPGSPESTESGESADSMEFPAA